MDLEGTSYIKVGTSAEYGRMLAAVREIDRLRQKLLQSHSSYHAPSPTTGGAGTIASGSFRGGLPIPQRNATEVDYLAVKQFAKENAVKLTLQDDLANLASTEAAVRGRLAADESGARQKLAMQLRVGLEQILFYQESYYRNLIVSEFEHFYQFAATNEPHWRRAAADAEQARIGQELVELHQKRELEKFLFKVEGLLETASKEKLELARGENEWYMLAQLQWAELASAHEKDMASRAAKADLARRASSMSGSTSAAGTTAAASGKQSPPPTPTTAAKPSPTAAPASTTASGYIDLGIFGRSDLASQGYPSTTGKAPVATAAAPAVGASSKQVATTPAAATYTSSSGAFPSANLSSTPTAPVTNTAPGKTVAGQAPAGTGSPNQAAAAKPSMFGIQPMTSSLLSTASSSAAGKPPPTVASSLNSSNSTQVLGGPSTTSNLAASGSIKPLAASSPVSTPQPISGYQLPSGSLVSSGTTAASMTSSTVSANQTSPYVANGNYNSSTVGSYGGSAAAPYNTATVAASATSQPPVAQRTIPTQPQPQPQPHLQPSSNWQPQSSGTPMMQPSLVTNQQVPSASGSPYGQNQYFGNGYVSSAPQGYMQQAPGGMSSNMGSPYGGYPQQQQPQPFQQPQYGSSQQQSIHDGMHVWHQAPSGFQDPYADGSGMGMGSAYYR